MGTIRDAQLLGGLLHLAPEFPVFVAIAIVRVEGVLRPAVELDIVSGDDMER